jgi:DNA-binding GntR family transcriptional regulator
LLAEGLVVETSAGLMVKQLSEQEIMELYEIRVPLETLAARLAAEHLTPLHLAHIEALNEKFAAVAEHQDGENDPEVLVAINLDLHRAIAEASQNRFLIDFMSRMYDSVGRFRNRIYRNAECVAETVVEHQALTAAIAARDPERAAEIAQKHMRRAREAVLAMFRDAHRFAEQVRS